MNFKPKKDVAIKHLTAIKIGGPTRYFASIATLEDLRNALEWAKSRQIKWTAIGGGSNIIASDNGFDGLLIRVAAQNFKVDRERVYVGAGNNLFESIKKLNNLELAGLEKMAGIPGTIGGAIYGNAGAYGQEISNHLVKAEIFDPRQNRVFWLSKNECQFGYRDSIFKKKNWIILGAAFKFQKDSSAELKKVSKNIVRIREEKYWPEFLCPGSFFKNIALFDLRPEVCENFIKKIDPVKIVFNKVAAGYLLEEAGAKGMKIGDIRVADHHANLIYNAGQGKARDVKKLADILKKKVKDRFDFDIEEEVRYLE
ncbi:MAG: UDP-N-acetylmuramate dehydrogenase [Parcubacteria group bacterium]|nr:UDP-N-acetylmuramate dehydrogenase [Parcubacteria group bacterium]